MTQPWRAAPHWRGQRVGVLLSGPSMTVRVACDMRARCDRIIAVKFTARVAPWADALVALDSPWPQEFLGFGGMRITGSEDAQLEAFSVAHTHERVVTGEGVLCIRNSGLAAVRVAADLGAARILIAGFEPEAQRRWHDAPASAARPYAGVREGMGQIVRELQARQIEVEFHRV